eukprot:4202412-Pyramimonas_sp.AAC.2
MAAALVIGSAFSAPTSPFCSLSSGRDSGVRMACGCDGRARAARKIALVGAGTRLRGAAERQ